MAGRLSGLVTVVTGSSSGIGRGIADEFERQGAVVHAADVTMPETPQTSKSRVEHELDVRDEQQWIELMRGILEDHGRIDVLVNNAGVGGRRSFAEEDRAEWDRIVSVNQLGTFLGMRTVIPGMTERGHGAVVNISSIFGSRAVAGSAAYHASKAAVLGLTRSGAMTYARAGVRVNAILPGWIRTPLTEGQPESTNRQFIEDTALGHGGEPADVAMAAVYLASDEARFVTGVALPVDGGYLAK